ncbi:hypothetical protein JCM8547_006477 [Rhodosporidiobolus lusitaniae]
MEGQADETVHDSAALEATSVNPVASHSAEADAYGTAVPPELFPSGEPGTIEGGDNPFPGHDAAEVVRHAMDPENVGFELRVPPQAAGDANEGVTMEAREGTADAKMDEDEEEADADDLFGDGGDDDDDEPMQEAQPAEEASQAQQTYGSPPVDDEELAARRRLEYDEEGSDAGGSGNEQYGGAAAGSGLQQQEHETRDFVTAQVPLANYSVPAGGKVWHARMPGFLQIAVNPYDEESWQPEDLEKEEEMSQTQGEDVKPKVKKSHGALPDENVVRWRWTRDELNNVIKQSNARIVRWSDGSLSLQLGTELFDLSLAVDHSAVLTSTSSSLPVPPTLNPPTSSLTPSAFDQARAHGLTYLTARHGYNGTLSESQASVYGTISMRPAALSSRTHKKLAGAIASRNEKQKGRAVQRIATQEDPEKARAEREKKAAEKQRKAQKEARKAAGKGGRSGGGGGKKGGKKATVVEGLEIETDEEGSEGEGYGGGGRGGGRRRGGFNRDYSDEDDNGFVANSDDDMAVSDAGNESLEDLDAQLEREESRRRKDRSSKASKSRNASDSSEAEEREKEEGQSAAPRRRLVVESDEE